MAALPDFSQACLSHDDFRVIAQPGFRPTASICVLEGVSSANWLSTETSHQRLSEKAHQLENGFPCEASSALALVMSPVLDKILCDTTVKIAFTLENETSFVAWAYCVLCGCC